MPLSRPLLLSLTVLTLGLVVLGTALPAEASFDRTRVRVFSQYQEDSRFDLAGQPEHFDLVGRALATGDFNGDGYQDLAIGVPHEDYGSISNSGWVSVIYGGPGGLEAGSGREQLWDQGGAVAGAREAVDVLGDAVATGDFNRDGFDDLAVGVRREDIGDVLSAGAVNVLYGSPEGLVVAGNQIFYQEAVIDGAKVPGKSETSDHFGKTLAAGDFDGDGWDDLAIGVPEEDLGNVKDAGSLLIIYGHPVVGLHPKRTQGITRQSATGAGFASDDAFGRALAAGDFDGDGRDDLAVGVPFAGQAGSDAGAVDVFYGAPGGLDLSSRITATLDVPGVAGTAQQNDNLGFSLTTGDFDGDGYADLAAGLPERSCSGRSECGAALVLYGTANGLQAARSQFFQQGQNGLAGTMSPLDRFGYSLAAGDLDGDGADELMVGVLRDSVVSGSALLSFAGTVQVIPGVRGEGLDASGSETLDYSLVGEPAREDYFGYALAVGDFDGDQADDLAIGVPRRHVVDGDGSSIHEAGEVLVVPGQFGSGPCVPDAISLCLAANRFRVEVEWNAGAVGTGNAVPRTADSGFFWFFDPDNIELVVKVLDARAVNGHFWVFYGSLSDVAYTLRVTDEATGEQRVYTNPQGTFASRGDTQAFIDSESGSTVAPTDLQHRFESTLVEVDPPTELSEMSELPELLGTAGPAGAVPLVFDETADPATVAVAAASCQANQLALCLNGDRFFVQVDWRDFQGNTGDGNAVPVTDDTGAFWFFDAANLELVLKVLDGTDINGHWWVFFGALSNVEFEITVLDTVSGKVARYTNSLGNFASRGDTSAIPE